MLALLRPCGTILVLSELFIAESKAQVYGCLHNYFTQYPTVIDDLGKLNITTYPVISAAFCCYSSQNLSVMTMPAT